VIAMVPPIFEGRSERDSRHFPMTVLLVVGAAGLTAVVLGIVIGGPFRSKPSSPAVRIQCSDQSAPRASSTRSEPFSAQEEKRSGPAAPDLTLSFDAEPAYCEWASVQPGFNCAHGAVDQTSTAKAPSAALVRDDSPGNVRDGKYSARVVLNPGDHSSYSCQKEAVMAIKDLGEGEGSESWWG
jgi:hypothetical protein